MRHLFVNALLVSFSAVAQQEWPTLSGDYLVQEPPGMSPVVFAPDLISLDGERELNAVYSPDGRIFMFTREVNGAFKMFYSSFR